MPTGILDFSEIRKLVIVAMFSDDTLLEALVLKGGNALNLVHAIGTRSSVDVDFSIDGDFQDFEDTKRRILGALGDRFGSAGYRVFDVVFEQRPNIVGLDLNPKWGGYTVKFKIIENEKYEQLQSDLNKLRINATVTGPLQHRTFTIDISKFEFCEGKQEIIFNDYTIYVYTPSMLAIEKLRAICQQMPEYPLNPHKTARARDFYDIYSLVEQTHIDLSTRDSHELVKNIFAAKEVSLALIRKVADVRDLHRGDWPSVRDSVSGKLEEFDFYFNYVVDQIQLLKPLWVV